MDIRQEILTNLYRHMRENVWMEEWHWDHVTFVRACLVRFEQGQLSAWNEFVNFLSGRDMLARTIRCYLEGKGYLGVRRAEDFDLADTVPSQTAVSQVGDLVVVLDAAWQRRTLDTPSSELGTEKVKSEVMYIEAKPGLTGPARICRVRFSKTRKTLYYDGHSFQSLATSGMRSCGYKCNYRDVETDEEYWISRCRKDGQDTLYPGIVEIDEDVREEYWQQIRRKPTMVHRTSFKSNGKYRR